MRRIVIALGAGLIIIAASVLNANAQMCGCREGAGGMMGGMGHKDMGMMQGMKGMHEEGMMGEAPPMLKMLMSLGLDDKQKDAIRAIHSKTMKEMARKQADKQIAEIELKDLLAKDPVDVKAVEAAEKKKLSIKGEMFMAHIKAHEEVKALLTPEQKKKLKEMMGGGGPGCCMMHGDMGPKDMPMHEPMH